MKKGKVSLSYELVITTRHSAVAGLEIIKESLIGQGIVLEDIVEVDEFPYKHLSVYFTSQQKAKSLQRRLKALKIRRLTLKIMTHLKEDWFNKWKEDFTAFDLTPRIRVVPAWEEVPKKKAAVNIVLDTGFAFGSGTHPTTRFMARIIDSQRAKFSSFIDIGTGSGILALVALMNGCRDVEAVDISKDAVISARENFRRNGFTRTKVSRADIGKFKLKKKYDFVAANLITHDLMKLKRIIVGLIKRGKYLAISGISVNNFPLLKKDFSTLPIKCLRVLKGEDWYALLYQKF